MRIGEVDIFLYVNDPKALSEDKLNYISLNEEKFSKEIEFYRSLNSKISEVEEDRLNPEDLIIHADEPVILFPVEPQTTNGKRYKLAAGSDMLEETDSIKTFMDKQNNYLIRVHKSKGRTKFYLFSSEKEVIQNFKVIIYPDNIELNCKDNRTPIELERAVEVEKLEIRMNS